MPFQELTKNFEQIRGYMRDFFVYGFRTRSEYDRKSGRSYDDVRRRVESWLGDYMGFRQDASGKNVFLSVDSRSVPGNPLYRALKARSFTTGDITFHFYILDVLRDGQCLSVREIVERFQEYANCFPEAESLDESTVRKKLREYVDIGLLRWEKKGRELFYSLSVDTTDLAAWGKALAFYSEQEPLGIVGSTLLDQLAEKRDLFRFKHHYILSALDSEILLSLLQAIDEGQNTELTIRPRRQNEERTHVVFPLKIYCSTQTGRQYLYCFHPQYDRPMFFRIDGIRKVRPAEYPDDPEMYRQAVQEEENHLWGVSTRNRGGLEHLEMTIHVGNGEEFIVQRLEREKRCGRLEQLDGETYRFSADVYDVLEMMPWVRTFIGRIVDLACSNPQFTRKFLEDLEAMRGLYGEETDEDR